MALTMAIRQEPMARKTLWIYNDMLASAQSKFANVGMVKGNVRKKRRHPF